MTKIRVYFDENGQISTDSIVRSLDGSAAPTLTPELLNKARPIDTGEIEAYDPKTGKNITVPDGVNVDMARLNAQIKDNTNAIIFFMQAPPHWFCISWSERLLFSIQRIENHHTYYLLLLTYYFTKNPNAVQGNSEKVKGKK